MHLRITDSKIHPIGGSIPELRNARTRWTERRGFLVRVRVDGDWGVGEASPLPGYSPDTLDACEEALDALTAPGAVAIDPDGPRVEAEVSTASPAARFAVELAIADAMARGRSCSVAAWLAPGRPAPALATTRWLTSGDPVPPPGTSVKVKIGADLDAELAHVRDLCARDLRVRVDANQSLGADAAREVLPALARCGVELVEEPCDSELLGEIDLPLPVALDETLRHRRGEAIARSLARRRRLAALVLKPAVLGSLSVIEVWVRCARDLGVRVVLSHLADGPIALAGYCELALAWGSAGSHGIDRHQGLGAFPRWPVPHIRDGAIVPSRSPGLGVQGPWA